MSHSGFKNDWQKEHLQRLVWTGEKLEGNKSKTTAGWIDALDLASGVVPYKFVVNLIGSSIFSICEYLIFLIFFNFFLVKVQIPQSYFF